MMPVMGTQGMDGNFPRLFNPQAYGYAEAVYN